MAGRTLLQQARPRPRSGSRPPGGWPASTRPRRRLRDGRARLAVQLGGAVGHGRGIGARAARAAGGVRRSDRAREPPLPWHTDRSRVGELAGALGRPSAACAKIAADVMLLAQTEVGEVREGGAGRGGSSAMPHKHNPVGAVLGPRRPRGAPPGWSHAAVAAMSRSTSGRPAPGTPSGRPLRELLHLAGGAGGA